MMSKILKYSVLRYSPSTVSGERINLGIIFCDMESGYREFRYSRKYTRLLTFDDEIDLTMVKKMLQGIADDVQGNIFTYDTFDIEQYTKFFVNNFSFEKPKSICYDKLEDIMERLHKTYFRFEYERRERPSKEDDRAILENLISAEGKEVKRDEYVLGSCNERIKYDLVTDKSCIKLFDFDDKNLNHLVNSAKTWAWNAMHEDEKKVIIIYRYNEEHSRYNKEFKIIMDILKKSKADVYDIEEGMQVMQRA